MEAASQSRSKDFSEIASSVSRTRTSTASPPVSGLAIPSRICRTGGSSESTRNDCGQVSRRGRIGRLSDGGEIYDETTLPIDKCGFGAVDHALGGLQPQLNPGRTVADGTRQPYRNLVERFEDLFFCPQARSGTQVECQGHQQAEPAQRRITRTSGTSGNTPL